MDSPDKKLFFRKVRNLGQKDAHFTFSQVRNALGIDATSQRVMANKLWHWFKDLEGDTVVEQVAGSRKRNRYWRLIDESKLVARINANGSTSAAPDSATVDRLGPVARFTQLERKIDTLHAVLTSIDGKLDDLVQMWS